MERADREAEQAEEEADDAQEWQIITQLPIILLLSNSFIFLSFYSSMNRSSSNIKVSRVEVFFEISEEKRQLLYLYVYLLLDFAGNIRRARGHCYK